MLVPHLEFHEFGAQHHCLDGVQTRIDPDDSCTYLLKLPWEPSVRTRAATPASSVMTAPASPAAPRFLPG